MNKNYELDHRLIELVDIDNIEVIEHINGMDLEVEEDQTFTLANGIISHNSAAKSLFAARGKNPYIGTYPLRGKLLNVREKEIARVLGLDKKKEGKTAPNEIQKILTII
jgi:DNA gyrase/topoisomerase IV subunit B